MSKTVKTTIIVVVTLLVLGALCCGGVLLLTGVGSSAISNSLKNEPKLVGTSSLSSSSSQLTTIQAPKTYKKGDIVNSDGVNIVVLEVKDYVSKNMFMKEEAGKKSLAILVSEENVSNEEKSYNSLNFSLINKDGVKYSIAFTDAEPYLSSGTMQPTKKAKGYIAFSVPVDVKNSQLELVYSPTIFTSSGEITWELE